MSSVGASKSAGVRVDVQNFAGGQAPAAPVLTQALRKVASRSLSRVVAHFLIYRKLRKGKVDAYVLDLWPESSKIE